ncbi:MAG: hypothetical protein ACI3ZK_04920 [Candidatus Cryptobacteroides sp.]
MCLRIDICFNLLLCRTSLQNCGTKISQNDENMCILADFYFEFLIPFAICSQHIGEIKNALRIKSSGTDYCWSGATEEGKNVQIDMLIPSADERNDYVCEIKFSENKYQISAEYEQSLLNKIDAFKASNNHKSSHSILLVMITSLGLVESIHNRCVNASLSLEDLMN